VNSQGIQLPFSEQGSYFLRRYAKAIGVSLILLAAFFYVRYRHALQQQVQQAQVAAAYADIVPLLTAEKEQAEQAEKTIEEFIEQHQKSVYGTLLALQWAKHWVDQKAYDRAAVQLTTALQRTQDGDLQALIRLRLARLQCQLHQPAEALKTVEAIQKSQAWWLSAQVLRGDILRHQQDVAGARAAYQQVLNSGPSPLYHLAKLWLNDLSDHQEKP
jgi:predicted negative regulator of RcsB-dependent stress response